MSDLYFYKIAKPTERLPDVVDLDTYDHETNPFPYEYTEAEKAEDWMRQHGILRTVRYTTVNTFEAAEKILGIRPVSATYHWQDGSETFYDETNNKIGTITKQQLDQHRFVKEVQAYIYEKTVICSAQVFYTDPEISGIADHDALVRLAEKIAQEEEEYYDFEGEKVWALMKAAAAVSDGAVILAVYD